MLDIDPARIVKKSRLEPGKMLLVDTLAGRVIGDEELKERYARRNPYGEWLDRNLVRLRELPIPNKKVEMYTSQRRAQVQKAFGYTYEAVSYTHLDVYKRQGYLIQLMPGADEAVISAVERGIAQVGAVTAALDRGDDALELLRQVLSDFELEILETAPVEYRCYCSRERVSRALISMGRDELEKLIAEQHGAELTCQFCDRVYQFTEEELQSLLDEATEK